jgi:hypothetical protein
MGVQPDRRPVRSGPPAAQGFVPQASKEAEESKRKQASAALAAAAVVIAAALSLAWFRAAGQIALSATPAAAGVDSSIGYGPAFGIFPRGCKWRSEIDNLPSNATQQRGPRLQFWDTRRSVWASSMPIECSPTGLDASNMPPGWDFRNGTPRSEVCMHPARCCMCSVYKFCQVPQPLPSSISHLPNALPNGCRSFTVTIMRVSISTFCTTTAASMSWWTAKRTCR